MGLETCSAISSPIGLTDGSVPSSGSGLESKEAPVAGDRREEAVHDEPRSPFVLSYSTLNEMLPGCELSQRSSCFIDRTPTGPTTPSRHPSTPTLTRVAPPGTIRDASPSAASESRDVDGRNPRASNSSVLSSPEATRSVSSSSRFEPRLDALEASPTRPGPRLRAPQLGPERRPTRHPTPARPRGC